MDLISTNVFVFHGNYIKLHFGLIYLLIHLSHFILVRIPVDPRSTKEEYTPDRTPVCRRKQISLDKVALFDGDP